MKIERAVYCKRKTLYGSSWKFFLQNLWIYYKLMTSKLIITTSSSTILRTTRFTIPFLHTFVYLLSFALFCDIFPSRILNGKIIIKKEFSIRKRLDLFAQYHPFLWSLVYGKWPVIDSVLSKNEVSKTFHKLLKYILNSSTTYYGLNWCQKLKYYHWIMSFFFFFLCK